MYYSIEVYNEQYGDWREMTASRDIDVAKHRWEVYLSNGMRTRVREVRDITSGSVWLD